MKSIDENGLAAMAILVMVTFNTLFLSANGLFMLVAPAAVVRVRCPGVTDTGFFNQHFIRDIGIIQLFLGVAFGVGLAVPERRVGLWLVATLWLAAHAFFHLWEVAVGICAPSALLRDFPAVSLPAIIGRRPDTVGDPGRRHARRPPTPDPAVPHPASHNEVRHVRTEREGRHRHRWQLRHRPGRRPGLRQARAPRSSSPARRAAAARGGRGRPFRHRRPGGGCGIPRGRRAGRGRGGRDAGAGWTCW